MNSLRNWGETFKNYNRQLLGAVEQFHARDLCRIKAHILSIPGMWVINTGFAQEVLAASVNTGLKLCGGGGVTLTISEGLLLTFTAKCQSLTSRIVAQYFKT